MKQFVVMLFVVCTCFGCSSRPNITVVLHIHANGWPDTAVNTINHAMLTTGIRRLTGGWLGGFFENPVTPNYSGIAAISLGVFRLQNVPRDKYYVLVNTAVDSAHLSTTDFPAIDLRRATDTSVSFSIVFYNSLVRRYSDR